jgi:hypothetical protein
MKLKINLRDLVRQVADSDNMLTFEASVDVNNLFETACIPDEPDIDLRDLLDEQRAIALIWDADMVRSTYPHLTEDDAWQVLQVCEQCYSAENGLTWEDIGQVVAEHFPDPDGFLMPERIARCEKAFAPYADTDEANLRDLLADLMHWSKRKGQSFDDALEMARSHFHHEDRPDVHAILARNHMIGQLWTTNDVQELRPDLTDEQAWQVLQAVDRRQETSIGITFDTLDDVAEELFPEPIDKAEEE